MAKMTGILQWLANEGQRVIIKDAQEHIEETCKTVTFFADAVRAFIKNDVNAKSTSLENIRESEHKADSLKAKMIDKLAESVLVAPDREDLMRFIKTLDKIADWTLSSSRLLGFIENKMPDTICENMTAAAGLMVSAVSKLREGILALINNDVNKALVSIDEVNRLEHEADDRKKVLIKSILNAKLDPNNLMIMFHLADSMEGVTDQINNAADFIKIIVVKNK
jgi:predicted phosphate transport protein (TIGR00153 family)